VFIKTMVYVKRFTLNEECLYTKIEYILKSNAKNIILIRKYGNSGI